MNLINSWHYPYPKRRNSLLKAINCLLVVIILLFVFTSLSAQKVLKKELLGAWVKTKVEMKDGSVCLIRGEMVDGFLEYVFKDNNQIHIYTNFNALVANYSINDSILVAIGQTYIIEKLTENKLIISQFDTNQAPYYLKRIHFIREENYHSFYGKTLKLDNTFPVNDSIFVAEKYLFPLYENTITAKKANFPFDILVKIVISDEGKVDKVSVIENRLNTNNKKLNNIIQDLKSVLVSTWKPIKIEGKTIKSSLLLRYFSFKSLNNLTFSAIDNNFKYIVKYPLLPEKVRNNTNQYLKKGIQNFKDNKFEDAILNLNKCIELDNLCLDAFYYKIASHLKLNDKNSACKDLEYLKKLGQESAKILLKRYCE